MNRFANCLLFTLLCLAPFPALADLAADLRDCAHLEDDQERLSCYDRLAGVNGADTEIVALPSTPEDEAESALPAPEDEVPSLLTRRWDLDENRPRGRFALLLHRDNYLMPATYNNNYYLNFRRHAQQINI